MNYQGNNIGQRRPCTSAPFDVSLALFVAGMTTVYLFLVNNAFAIQPIPEIDHVGHLLLALSLFFCVIQGKLGNLKANYKLWFIGVSSSLLLMLAYGIMRGYNKYHLSRDVFALTYFSGLFLGANRRNWRVLDRMLFVHFILGAVLTIFSLLTFQGLPLRTEIIQTTTYNYTTIYKLNDLLYPWPYLLLTAPLRSKVGRVLCLAGVSTWLVTEVFYGGRICAGQFAFVSILGLFFYVRTTAGGLRSVSAAMRTAVNIAVAATVMGLTAVALDQHGVLSEAYGQLIARFSRKGDAYTTLVMNYRLQYEPREVIRQATPTELIFGQGLGASIEVTRNISSDGRWQQLHNSLAWLMLKGGIVLLCVWLLGWAGAALRLIGVKDYRLAVFHIVVAMYLTFMFLVPTIAPFPRFGLALMCLGVCVARRDKGNAHNLLPRKQLPRAIGRRPDSKMDGRGLTRQQTRQMVRHRPPSIGEAI